MVTSRCEGPRELLRRLGLRARKQLGQHFLVNEEVLSSIIEAAQLTPSDTVLEIGPGLGNLTEALARKAKKVIAVELDNRLASFLSKKFSSFHNVIIVARNILDTLPEDLLGTAFPADKHQVNILPTPYKVVANLPYYITAPIVRHFLEATLKPNLMVIMVQKEVAEVITAAPGSMSLFSVSVQFYGKPTIVAHVPSRDFYPPPEVDSTVVRIDVYERPPVMVDDIASFFNIVSAGFSSRRKQIHNALALRLGLDHNQVDACLEQAGIDRQARAQTLSLEQWARLYQSFSGLQTDVIS